MTLKKFALTDFEEVMKSEALFDIWMKAKKRDYLEISNKMSSNHKKQIARTCRILVEMMRSGSLLQHKYIADRVRPHKEEIRTILKFREPKRDHKIEKYIFDNPEIISRLAKVVNYMHKTARNRI